MKIPSEAPLRCRRGGASAGLPAARRALVLGTLGALGLGALRGLDPPARAAESGAGAALVELAPGVHVRPGVHEEASVANRDAIANAVVVVGREAVAVVDPGGSLSDGAQLRAAVRRLTALPVRYVVFTHVHPDHIFGAQAFADDAPRFVGHARLARALALRGEYYRGRLAALLGAAATGGVVAPDVAVEDRLVIDLGGHRLALHAHPTAHSDCDLSAFEEATQTLICGDLLFVERIPVLDGSIKGWLGELDALRRVAAARAVPGHGPASVDWPSAADDLERYLRVLQRETRAAYAKGADLDAAVATVGRSESGRWRLFEEYHERNVTQAYKEVEWE